MSESVNPGVLTAEQQSQIAEFLRANRWNAKAEALAPSLIARLQKHLSSQRSIDFGLREKQLVPLARWVPPLPLHYVLSFTMYDDSVAFLKKCRVPDAVPLFCALLDRLRLPAGLAGSSVGHSLERDLFERLLAALDDQGALEKGKQSLLTVLAERGNLTPSYVLDAMQRIVDDDIILGFYSVFTGLAEHPDGGKLFARFSSATLKHLAALRCETLRKLLVMPGMRVVALEHENDYSGRTQSLDTSSFEQQVRSELSRRCH